MGQVFGLFLRPRRGDLYECAGPIMGHLRHLFLKKTNARQMPGGWGEHAVGID